MRLCSEALPILPASDGVVIADYHHLGPAWAVPALWPCEHVHDTKRGKKLEESGAKLVIVAT